MQHNKEDKLGEELICQQVLAIVEHDAGFVVKIAEILSSIAIFADYSAVKS